MADSVLSLLRRAQRLDPELFDAAVRAYLEQGVAALSAPRPRGGRNKKIGRANYMMLLAFVMNQPPRSEARLLREWAARGMP